MKLDIGDRSELQEYLASQLEHFFPDKYKFKGNDIDIAMKLALERLENCFKYINIPAYSDNKGQTFFSYLHSDQYAHFLYYLSNSLWKISQNKPICDKLIYLNKALNGFFYSYKGSLPDIFFLGHPVGSVLGNANYSDFLVVFQNVTVNTSIDGEGNTAPVLGKGLCLSTGAKIIGNKSIGDCVSIGVDAVVYNQEIEADKVVIREPSGKIVVRERIAEQCMAQQYFNVPIK